MKYYLAGVASTLLILAVVVVGFFLGKESPGSSTRPLSPNRPIGGALQPPDTKESMIFEPTPAIPSSIAAVTAVKSKDYSILQGLITDPVSVRIENSGCCPPMSPEKAIAQLKYLNSAKGPWIFDEEDQLVKVLQASFPEHYGNAIIGVSSDNYLVAFQLDTDGKISKISMAQDYGLILE